MSELRATPGPWVVERSVIRGDADHLGRTVAVASTLNVAWPFGRRAAKEEPYNAHLIAAAPELYEALVALMDLESRDRVMPAGPEWDAARAALAKARGET